MRRPALLGAFLTGIFVTCAVGAQDKLAPPHCWPQFRGPGGSATAPDARPLPMQFGPDKNVAWRTDLPPGHSSPCIWADRIFLTGYDAKAKKLETICLDRDKGTILWRRGITPKKVENTHKINTPAASTPCTDGERVYVYFGSHGLLCYNFAGDLKWQRELPALHANFGTGSSPVIAGDLLIQSCDHQPKPYLLAVHKHNGETAWKAERVPAFEGYSTPFVWRHDGIEELILHTSARVLAYSLTDGTERWWVPHKSTACTTPAAGGGKLFVAAWAHGGEQGDLVPLPPFAKMVELYDKDGDGLISRKEFPDDLYVLKRKDATNVPNADIKLVWYFDQIDKNKDGKIDASEWAQVYQSSQMKSEHGLVAIKPGGQGDVGKSQTAWKHKNSVPEVSSPLFYQGQVYMLREGGILTCLDAESGAVRYKERLGAEGAYFASPVAGDGKVYACSYNGVVSVLAAGPKFSLLHQADFGERIMATPALVDGRAYLRTEKCLYALGK